MTALNWQLDDSDCISSCLRMGYLSAFLLLAFAAHSAAHAADVVWSAPIGIPEPPFGIHERHTMYSGQRGYHDAGNGPYTVYVDNSSADCSDSGPGTAAEPRCSIPTDISTPGAVVEVHGSRYDFGGTDLAIEVHGSVNQPVFLRGVDDGTGFPSIYDADITSIQGQYFIVENLGFDRSQVRTTNRGDAKYGRSHIGLRNLEIMHHPRKNGAGLVGSNIVFYRNHVHHNQADDRHGVTLGPGAEHVWVLDNNIHHNGGDSIQFCHGCRKAPPRNVYIGRNLLHSDRENAVDLKYGKNIVVSQNTMHSYVAARPDVRWCFDDGSGCRHFSSGSDGSAVVIGADGAPVNPWIIFNDIYNATQGVRVEEVAGAWIIGNSIHAISNRAFAFEKRGAPLYIVGNTIYDVKVCIDQYWRPRFTLNIHNNIFASIRADCFRVDEEVADNSTVDNNVFWNSGEAVYFQWGRRIGSASDSKDLNSLFGGKGNVFGNPQFVDASAGNFRLASMSVAIDSGSTQLEVMNSRFREIFGSELTIIRDIDGSDRPLDGNDDGVIAYDIGTHEYAGQAGAAQP